MMLAIKVKMIKTTKIIILIKTIDKMITSKNKWLMIKKTQMLMKNLMPGTQLTIRKLRIMINNQIYLMMTMDNNNSSKHQITTLIIQATVNLFQMDLIFSIPVQEDLKKINPIMYLLNKNNLETIYSTWILIQLLNKTMFHLI